MKIRTSFIPGFTILYGLSCCLTDSEARQTVKAAVGQNVTLPCVYNVKENRLLEACWGRGEIPLFKCTNTVIAADGNKVTMRLSDRYQLLSGLDRGNVSLTIINVAKEDSGLYGCRIEIFGLWNDQKHHFFLTVEEAPSVTAPPLTTVTTTTKFVTVSQRSKASDGTSAPSPGTSPPSPQSRVGQKLTIIIVLSVVVVSLLLAVSLTAFVLVKRKKWIKSKTQSDTCPTVVNPSNCYNELDIREMIENNIYEADG